MNVKKSKQFTGIFGVFLLGAVWSWRLRICLIRKQVIKQGYEKLFGCTGQGHNQDKHNHAGDGHQPDHITEFIPCQQKDPLYLVIIAEEDILEFGVSGPDEQFLADLMPDFCAIDLFHRVRSEVCDDIEQG